MRLSCLYINVLLLFFAVFLSGCETFDEITKLGMPIAASQNANLPTAARAEPIITPDFTLSSGDSLRVKVFGDEDLSNEYDIDARGYITMPLIGDIQAASLSVNDVQDDIIARLNEGFIVDPKVSIEVISLRPFYILGEVNNPGSYPTVPEMDVFKAIATAGGLTPRAVKDRYVIFRGFANNRAEIHADDQTPVFPGDSIKVKERFF